MSDTAWVESSDGQSLKDVAEHALSDGKSAPRRASQVAFVMPLDLAALASTLGIPTAHSAEWGLEPLYCPDDNHGPWLFSVDEAVQRRLAALTDDEIPDVLRRWTGRPADEESAHLFLSETRAFMRDVTSPAHTYYWMGL
jgi:hypothetical protein